MSMSAYDAGQWTGFGLAVAVATAALTGLVLVAVSANVERILRFPALPRLTATTLVLFGSALLASLLVLVPGQTHRVLGTELLLLGILTALVTLPRLLLERPYETRSTIWPWALSGVLPTLLTSLCLVLAGAGYSFQGLGGLYWLVGAVGAAIFGGLGNAWMLLVESQR
jgi:modulator of FtsH protease